MSMISTTSEQASPTDEDCEMWFKPEEKDSKWIFYLLFLSLRRIFYKVVENGLISSRHKIKLLLLHINPWVIIM